jgi:hypothetical protein
LAVLVGLFEALEPLGLERVVLHANEPDDDQLEEQAKHVAALPTGFRGKVTVNVLQQRFQFLAKSLRRGRVRLDPPPTFGTCLHMAYYLKQQQDTIPALAEVPGVVGDDGLTFYVIEGPGQLQDMKQHLKRTRGLPEPASQAMILNTLRNAQIPHTTTPLVIPNTWPVDMTKDPGEMFYDAWRFLLLGNWGSRPIEWGDYVEAGTYVQSQAVLDGDGNPCLYGPDALILAGPWLAEHPRDLAALERMAHASVAEGEAFHQSLAAASPGGALLAGQTVHAES